MQQNSRSDNVILTDMSEEYGDYVFRVEELAEQATTQQCSTLKMEAVCCSETLVSFCRTPSHLHSYCSENVEPKIKELFV